MITSRIEKAILSGWATYKKINHAFGSFGGVVIPKDHTAIILDVTWNHFFNPLLPNIKSNSIADFIRFSEYQLKIDGKKSNNILLYKNIFDFQLTKWDLEFDITQTIDSYRFDLGRYFVPKHSEPIKKDVFFVCEEYINLTISRNTFIDTINTDFQPLNPVANQKPIPYGIGGQNTSCNIELNNAFNPPMLYIPPSRKEALPNSFGTNDLTLESYSQVYGDDSFFIPPQENYTYFTNPLIELGIVIFNSNDFDKIANQ